MALVKTTKKDRIYQYLINGYYAEEIKDFKDIKCTKGYLSQVIKDFLKKDYIKLIDKYPKRYGESLVPYPRMFSDFTSGLSKDPLEQPRIHLNIIKYKILEKPKLELKNEKNIKIQTWENNNTKYIQLSRITDIGTVHFRLCNYKTLILYTPGFFTEPINFRQTKIMLVQKAEELANWFTKTYACKLGEMQIATKSDIAIGEADPYMQDMNQKYGAVKLVDHTGKVIYWWDNSKDYFEFETRKEDIAEIKVFMPLIVKNLQDRVFNIQQQLEAQNMVIESFELKIQKLREQQNKFFDEILNIVKEKEPPKIDKNDEYIDVT